MTAPLHICGICGNALFRGIWCCEKCFEGFQKDFPPGGRSEGAFQDWIQEKAEGVLRAASRRLCSAWRAKGKKNAEEIRTLSERLGAAAALLASLKPKPDTPLRPEQDIPHISDLGFFSQDEVRDD